MGHAVAVRRRVYRREDIQVCYRREDIQEYNAKEGLQEGGYTRMLHGWME